MSRVRYTYEGCRRLGKKYNLQENIIYTERKLYNTNNIFKKLYYKLKLKKLERKEI